MKSKLVKIKLRIERFCEAGSRDGGTMKIPLEVSKDDAKRIKKFLSGSGIYAVTGLKS